MNATEKQDKNQYLLFDADSVHQFSLDQFEQARSTSDSSATVSARGRGRIYFIECADIPCVLRHYYRGGWAAKVSRDIYWWSSLAATRAWREWYLLARIKSFGLPVPKPIAARVVKYGLWYRGDIVVERILDSCSLAELLTKNALKDVHWRALGAVLRRFHHRGVFHADLNAHNVLFTVSHDIYLIDFDKGELRESQRGWQQQNLKRLRRSLRKLSRQAGVFHFAEEDWQALMAGYTQL